MMLSRVLHNSLNGRFTIAELRPELGRDSYCSRIADRGIDDSYEDAIPHENSNYWSVTENSATNAWNVNFSDGNVNNNNNKYNSNVVRAVVAYDGLSGDFALFVDSIVCAYFICLKGKKSSEQTIHYMQKADEDLPMLAKELWDGVYHPTTSICFLVKYPKLREVFAANFRDRIVHIWICLRLEPLFELRFESQGNVTYNNRKTFGTHLCAEECLKNIEKISDNYQKEAWIFRGDLAGFFMSIDKNLLWYLLERFIKRWRKKYEREGWKSITPELLDRIKLKQMPNMYWDILIHTVEIIVKHHPEKDCILNTSPDDWLGLAKNKSLFTCGEDKGEPIGNLTTQLFANFLMSFFDMFVRFIFRNKNYAYGRFVDDFYIVCDDKDFLLKAIPRLEQFLHDKLKLTLHKNKRYLQEVSHGLLLVGIYIKPNRTYLSNRTFGKFQEVVIKMNKFIENSDELSNTDCMYIEQKVNSYLGFCKHRKSYNKRKKILRLFGKKFYNYFYIQGHYDVIRTKKKYRMFNI